MQILLTGFQRQLTYRCQVPLQRLFTLTLEEKKGPRCLVWSFYFPLPEKNILIKGAIIYAVVIVPFLDHLHVEVSLKPHSVFRKKRFRKNLRKFHFAKSSAREDVISQGDVCNLSLSTATEGIICCWNRLSTVVVVCVCEHVFLMKRETMEKLKNLSCIVNHTRLF